MMTEQWTKHKVGHLEIQHMTPSEGRPTEPHPPGPPRRRRQNVGRESHAPSVWSVPWDEAASNAVIWLTDPNPLRKLKNSLVSRKNSEPNRFVFGWNDTLPGGNESLPARPHMSLSTLVFLTVLFSSSQIRGNGVDACLSSQDCEPERQTWCILHLHRVGTKYVCWIWQKLLRDEIFKVASINIESSSSFADRQPRVLAEKVNRATARWKQGREWGEVSTACWQTHSHGRNFRTSVNKTS